MKFDSKKDFADLIMGILDPLKDKYSEKCAFLNVGNYMACYGDKTAAIEAFARVLWAFRHFGVVEVVMLILKKYI